MRSRLAVAGGVLLAGAALLSTGALQVARDAYRKRSRAAHRARGETELRVVNPAGAALSLHRAGDTLDTAASLAVPHEVTWLPVGRYFLEASFGGARQLFPISVDENHEPPEPDGTWPVTIRRTSSESPPQLDAKLPAFVFIPGGYSVIGKRDNPGQAHAVWVPAFYLAAFEVTNGEYRRFLGDPQGAADRSNWTEAGWTWKTSHASQATALLLPADPRYRRFGRDELPVMLVTWYEANAYCRWLTRRIGAGRWLFRMPTESEWEKAARGPDGLDYGLGMELSEPQSGLYNWRKNPDAEVTLVGVNETRQRYAANRYGIYHSSGNAREWTQSLFRHYNAEHPYRDDDRNADQASGMRVTRGGSWYSASAVRLQVGYREEFQPELSSDDLGFRVAAVLGAGSGGRE